LKLYIVETEANSTKNVINNLQPKEVDFLYFIYEQLQEGLIILDLNDNIIFVNNKFCELVGYSREELMGLSAFETLYLEDDREMMRTRNIFRQKGINELYEFRFKRKDNTVIYVLVNANPLKEKTGEISGFMASCIDISARKIEEDRNKKLFNELIETKLLLEQNLNQKNKLIDELIETKAELQLSNAEKDKFFSIITHDLKNAFSGFLNYIKLFSDDIGSFTIQELSDFMKQMQISSESLFKLLENLLEWSKIKRGAINYQPISHNIKLILTQIVDILTINAANKNIKLITNIDDNIESFIDLQMFNTIMRNIIQNAIKFTPNGGTVEIGYKEDEKYDIFFVKDSGIGMTSEIKNHLFKLDKKTSREGTDGEPSTGLGLLLSKEFTELHNGKIYVESEPGNGSTFYIAFPKV